MVSVADALALAASGWHVFPLIGKAPNGRLAPNGCHSGTRDADTIRAWWAAGDWNVGGHHPGIVTLDTDPRNGGSIDKLAELAGCPIPRTLATISGRGDGGAHLHYRHPGIDLIATALAGSGIDLKVPGKGYLVLPPSLHPATGRPYSWLEHPLAPLPAPLLDLLRKRPPVRRPKPVVMPSAARSGLPKFVAGLGEGERNSGLFWAACEAARQGTLDDLEHDLIQSAMHAGLDDREARTVIASARRTEAA